MLSKLGVDATQEQVVALRKELGLDKSGYAAYGNWLEKSLHGDMGKSIRFSVPVNDLIKKRIDKTFKLSFLAMGITIGVGFPLGIISAVYNKGKGGKILSFFTMFGVSVPSFWSGLILMMIFGLYFKISLNSTNLILPAVTLSISMISVTAIYLKNIILEEFHKDYVRAAVAKGRNRNEVIITDILRNIMLPMLTIISELFIKILAGSIVVESLFNISGLGTLMVMAVENRDYPVVQALVLYSAVIVIGINLLTDILYSWIDPRVKISSFFLKGNFKK